MFILGRCYEIHAETATIPCYILLKHRVFENFVNGNLLRCLFLEAVSVVTCEWSSSHALSIDLYGSRNYSLQFIVDRKFQRLKKLLTIRLTCASIGKWRLWGKVFGLFYMLSSHTWVMNGLTWIYCTLLSIPALSLYFENWFLLNNL